MENLPIYKLVIDREDSGVDFIALVDRPAIERNWVAFNKSSKFSVTSEPKRIISGPLMISDMPIYRFDEQIGEYYAVFDSDTIMKIAQRYFKNKFTSNVNIDHNPNMAVNDVYLFESYIIDRERGINPPKGFEDVSNGSWFGSFKVDNEEVWNKFIATGELKGFSIEGLFAHVRVKNKATKPEDILTEIKSYLDKYFHPLR